ncbi:MAG: DUF4199 domain-containing protein [Thermoanaerobaculia bacterium]|nr:DUF4199 domain-containing protein [Thermoanaerobaculia bacterium]
MKKIILTYGLISGAIAAVLMLGMALYMDNDPERFGGGEIVGYAGIILSMVFVFLGVRAYRDQLAGGRLSFGKGFQVGILITLISCVCYVIAWHVISSTMMTDFMEKYVQYTLEQMKKEGATEIAIAQKSAEMERLGEMYKNPFVKSAITFLEPFPIGLLVTLLSAGILRKS